MPSSIMLGRNTETGVRTIAFDCKAWLTKYPDLSISVWATLPGQSQAYPADTYMDEMKCVWIIKDTDTSYAGNGKVELIGISDDKKIISAYAMTIIQDITSSSTSEPEEPQKPWVDRVLMAVRNSGSASNALNLLDNSNFAAPVNQRGLSEYIGIGYIIDRWKNVTSAGTISLIESGIELKTTSSTAAYIIQYLSETDRIYYGKTYTFALGLMDGSVYTVTAAYPDALPTGAKKLATAEIPGGEITIHTRANRPAPYVQIRLSKGEPPLHMAWAAVYEGAMDTETVPEYLPKSYAIECAECARYYQRIGKTIEHAQPYYDVTKYFQQMRAVPKATLINTNGGKVNIVVQKDGAAASEEVAASVTALSESSLRIECQGGAGTYSFNYIELDANL